MADNMYTLKKWLQPNGFHEDLTSTGRVLSYIALPIAILYLIALFYLGGRLQQDKDKWIKLEANVEQGCVCDSTVKSYACAQRSCMTTVRYTVGLNTYRNTIFTNNLCPKAATVTIYYNRDDPQTIRLPSAAHPAWYFVLGVINVLVALVLFVWVRKNQAFSYVLGLLWLLIIVVGVIMHSTCLFKSY